MNSDRFLAREAIGDFLAKLIQTGYTVFCPQKQAGVRQSVIFAPWQKGQEILLDKATVAPKHLVLPQSEVLFRYTMQKDSAQPEKVDVSLDDSQASTPTVLFAARPCDARGFAILDRPYLEGLFRDPYYAKRREALCVLTLTCSSGCATCFCHWTGAGPSSPEGSDILMTEIAEGFVLQAITDKGKKLLAASQLPEAGEKSEQATSARKAAWQSLEKAPDLSQAPQKLAEVFDDQDFWRHWTQACLSCGACTYVCPTCYCFTITDERLGKKDHEEGVRLRSWDTCMARHFTEEASGHNPRPDKAQRMRNRVSHKFSSYPENWGAFSCSGCGRCVTHCPVGLDIRAIVLAALAATSPQQRAKEAS
ncbi:MAG: 4Fe-4S dicluster domain-containing protein [Desulfovibrio sp.]|nr:4Fe-4S dicluster domain-containing protein [Desulfovibrio sp.]